jgi:Tfp pilus assembly protein PilP
MKLTKSLMVVVVAGGTLWAQTPASTAARLAGGVTSDKPAAEQPAVAKPAVAKPASASKTPVAAAKAPAKAPAAAAKSPAKAPAATAAAATTKPTGAVKPAVTAVKTEQKPATPHVKSPLATKAEMAAKIKKAEKVEAAKPASVKEQTQVSRVTAAGPGHRDPFLSPIVRAMGNGPACETGKRCLMVDQIQLKGVVTSPNGNIAVVENAAKRAYFLRENDPVFNGSVVKITGDSVVFREMFTDKLGKQSSREVTKRVNAPVV